MQQGLKKKKRNQRVSVLSLSKFGIWVSGFVHAPVLKACEELHPERLLLFGCNCKILHSLLVGVSYQSLYLSWAWATFKKISRILTFSVAVKNFVNRNEEIALIQVSNALNSTAVTLYMISNMCNRIQEASKTQICLSALFPLKPMAISMSVG